MIRITDCAGSHTVNVIVTKTMMVSVKIPPLSIRGRKDNSVFKKWRGKRKARKLLLERIRLHHSEWYVWSVLEAGMENDRAEWNRFNGEFLTDTEPLVKLVWPQVRFK